MLLSSQGIFSCGKLTLETTKTREVEIGRSPGFADQVSLDKSVNSKFSKTLNQTIKWSQELWNTPLTPALITQRPHSSRDYTDHWSLKFDLQNPFKKKQNKQTNQNKTQTIDKPPPLKPQTDVVNWGGRDS